MDSWDIPLTQTQFTQELDFIRAIDPPVSPIAVPVFRRDQTLVADLVEDSLIAVVDWRSGVDQDLLQIGFDNPDFLVSSKDGSLLAVVSTASNMVEIWDLDSASLKITIAVDDYAGALYWRPWINLIGAFSQNRRLFVIAGCTSSRHINAAPECLESTIVGYDTISGREILSIRDGWISPLAISINSDSSLLAIAGVGEESREFQVWEISSAEMVFRFVAPDGEINSVIFDSEEPDRLYLPAYWSSSHIYAWIASTGMMDTIELDAEVSELFFASEEMIVSRNSGNQAFISWLNPLSTILLTPGFGYRLGAIYVDSGGYRIVVNHDGRMSLFERP